MKRMLAVVCVCAGVSAASAQEPSLEYQVKAAYLLNFTRFVDWPQGAFGQGAPFTICVAGRNPFGPALEATLEGETAAGRGLASRVVRDTAADCHALFVPRGVAAAPYLRSVRAAPVLTVGETEEFLMQGGMIRFVMDNGRIRFEINQDAATRAQLRISSRLLQLARNAGATR
jgi:hypothetical protein